MTTRSSYHHARTEQLLIEARRDMIRECCWSYPLELRPDFHGHGGKQYAALSRGGTKLEINIGSGAWSSTISDSNYLGVSGNVNVSESRELPGPAGVITGTRENFLLVLAKVFPERNMRGA